MQAALTGLSENLKEDMKVQGGYVGDQEERKTGGVDMIEIHCIQIWIRQRMKNTLKKIICCNPLYFYHWELCLTPISLNIRSLLLHVFCWDAVPKLMSFLGKKHSQGKYLPVLLSEERPFSEHWLRSAWKAMRRDANVLVQESCLLLSFLHSNRKSFP